MLSGSRPSSVQPTFTAAPPAQPAAATEDEWSFASALPQEAAKPREHQATISNTSVRVDLKAGRSSAAPNAMALIFAFTNNTASNITDLHFQLAVTKVWRPFFLTILTLLRYIHLLTPSQSFELALKPQTGRSLTPKQSRGITQEVGIWHAGNRALKVESAKLRWRLTYKVGEEVKNEMGEVPEFSIA
jgi:hypothetical protein